MEQRMNFYEKGYNATLALFGLGKYLSKSKIEKPLLDLLDYRISQINGCAFCLDMHSKDLRAEGETEQRLYVLDAWREAPFYSERERAALEWAEAVNKLDVPDEVYEKVKEQFTDEEIIDLTMAVISINCYNRINIAFKTTAGTYEPGQFAAQTA
jgi:AhpD family alkylhydroperoxidase